MMRKNQTPHRHRRTKAKIRIKKPDVTSTTAATESVLNTKEIDATEGQDLAVIDAPGAFLTSDIDKEVIVILENEMVYTMLEIDKDLYRKYVIHGKNGKNTCKSASERHCMEHSRKNSYTIGNCRKN